MAGDGIGHVQPLHRNGGDFLGLRQAVVGQRRTQRDFGAGDILGRDHNVFHRGGSGLVQTTFSQGDGDRIGSHIHRIRRHIRAVLQPEPGNFHGRGVSAGNGEITSLYRVRQSLTVVHLSGNVAAEDHRLCLENGQQRLVEQWAVEYNGVNVVKAGFNGQRAIQLHLIAGGVMDILQNQGDQRGQSALLRALRRKGAELIGRGNGASQQLHHFRVLVHGFRQQQIDFLFRGIHNDGEQIDVIQSGVVGYLDKVLLPVIGNGMVAHVELFQRN